MMGAQNIFTITKKTYIISGGVTKIKIRNVVFKYIKHET